MSVMASEAKQSPFGIVKSVAGELDKIIVMW